jgi:hypothetical protein
MKIFLDDERFPPAPEDEWVVVRSFNELVQVVSARGYPEFVSFDHDLGVGPNGMDCVKYLVLLDMDTGAMPKDFSFYVHSQNCVGAQNIQGYLEGYLQFKIKEAGLCLRT